MSEEEEFDSIPVRKVIHEIRDTRNKPMLKKDDNLEARLEKSQSQTLALITHNLELKKEFLIDKYPESSAQIEACEHEEQLKGLEQQLEENFQPPKKVAGRATLPLTPQDTDLDSAPTHQDLINRLYSTRKSRSKRETDINRKTESTNRISKLWNSLKESGYLNPESLGRAMKTSEPLSICPQCGGVSKYLAHKGATCSSCGYVVGQGVIGK